MIVVDTNILAYLFLGGERTDEARKAFQKDSLWAAPLLWRSEFRNILALYLRKEHLTLTDALQLIREAESLFEGAEYQVESAQILRLASSSQCSAYDCEFVALAVELGVPLITTDRQVLKEFPATVVSLHDFVSA